MENPGLLNLLGAKSTDFAPPHNPLGVIMTFFSRIIAATLALFAFTQGAQAQGCDRIYNPQTGQTVSVQCYNGMGHPIMNGPVLIGGQQIILANGQMSGCATRFSIRVGGQNIAAGLDTCLAQVAQNSAIRAVPSEMVTREVVTQRITTEERQVRSSEQYRTELYCPESDMYLSGRDCVLSVGGTEIRRISAVTRRIAVSSSGSTPQQNKGTPTMVGSLTCHLTDRSGNLVYDFFSKGSNNPLGSPVSDSDGGVECLAAGRKYGNPT